MVQTIDTHSPFGYCPTEKRMFNDLLDAFYEADRNIGNFVDYINVDKKEALILGIIGDHLFMGEPELFKGVLRRQRCLFLGDIPDGLHFKRVNDKLCKHH